MEYEYSIEETLRSLERQRKAEHTLVAMHTARLTNINETIAGFTQELERFAGRTAIDEPLIPTRHMTAPAELYPPRLI